MFLYLLPYSCTSACARGFFFFLRIPAAFDGPTLPYPPSICTHAHKNARQNTHNCTHGWCDALRKRRTSPACCRRKARRRSHSRKTHGEERSVGGRPRDGGRSQRRAGCRVTLSYPSCASCRRVSRAHGPALQSGRWCSVCRDLTKFGHFAASDWCLRA